MTLKIKTIEQPAIVVDQGVTTNLNAGDSYTCSEPEEKLDFILTIDTTISDVSPSDTIKLQFLSGNFLVNWGDGIEEYYDFTSQTRIEHQYTTGGVYDILFNGCGVIQNSSPNFSDRKKTIAVKQWGKFFSSALSNAFPNNTNISSFPQSETLSCFSGSYQSSFLNIPLSNFGKINTSCILNFSSMFYGSNFDYNIGGWNISKARNFTDTFFGTSMSVANCDAIFLGWTRWANGQANITLQSNVSLHMGNTDYTRGGDAEDAFNYLVNTLNWTITFS